MKIDQLIYQALLVVPQNAIDIELCLRITSRNTALAHCIGEVKASVGSMNSARSTVFGAS